MQAVLHKVTDSLLSSLILGNSGGHWQKWRWTCRWGWIHWL